MKLFLKFIAVAFLFTISIQDSYGQLARKLSYKEVAKMKTGKTYFFVYNEIPFMSTIIEKILKEHWTFNEYEVVFRGQMKQIKKDKGKYDSIVSVGNASLNFGGVSFHESNFTGRPQSLGRNYSIKGLFISRYFSKYAFRGRKWDLALYTNDLMETHECLKLHLRVLNFTLLEIDANKVNKLNLKKANKLFNKKNDYLKGRTAYILEDQFYFPKKIETEEDKDDYLKSMYEGDIKLIGLEALKKVVDSEEDVILIRFYQELDAIVCSAISCKTGEIVAFVGERKGDPWSALKKLDELRK